MTDRDRLILDDERRARLLAGGPPGEPAGLVPARRGAVSTPQCHCTTDFNPLVATPNTTPKGEPMTDRISDYRDGSQTPLTEWAARNAISNFEFAVLGGITDGIRAATIANVAATLAEALADDPGRPADILAAEVAETMIWETP